MAIRKSPDFLVRTKQNTQPRVSCARVVRLTFELLSFMATRRLNRGLCLLLFSANRSPFRIVPRRKYLSPLSNISRLKSTVLPANLPGLMMSDDKPIHACPGSGDEAAPTDAGKVKDLLQEEVSTFHVDMSD